MPRLTRRTALILMASGGGLVLVGRTERDRLDATTQIEGERDVDIAVASDPSAFLGIQGVGSDELTFTNQADAEATVTVDTEKDNGLEVADSDDETFDLAVDESRAVEFELTGVLSTLNKFPIFYDKHVDDTAEVFAEIGEDPHVHIDVVREIETRKHTEIKLESGYSPPAQSSVDFDMVDIDE